MDNFVDVEFFQNQCAILVKHLYIVYSFCGAFCYEKFIRFKFRCFLAVFLCVGYFYSSIPQLFILFDHDSKLQDIFPASGFFIFIQIPVLLAIIFYLKKTQFPQMFGIINEFANGLSTSLVSNDEKTYSKEANIMMVHFNAYLYVEIFFMSLYLGKFSRILMNIANGTPFQVDPESEFFIPYLCYSCNTTTSYLFAFNSSFVLSVVFPIMYFGSLSLFWVLSLHLKNRAIVLQNTIRFHSNSAFDWLEKGCAEEEQELEKPYPSSFRLREINRKREQHIQEYMVKVRGWIKIHQHFIKSINQYQTCAKYVLELVMFNSSLCVVCVGYFISRFLIDSEDFKYQYLPFMVINSIILLICCKLGTILNDVSATISDAVYSTPWYYLPVNEQKIMLIFLTLSQKTQELRLFNIFSLSLERFPGILNEAYNDIQIMRLLVMRSRK